MSHADTPNYFYKLHKAFLRIPRPRPGQAPAFGEMTSPQKWVAALIAGRMHGQAKLLRLTDFDIAVDLGWDANVTRQEAAIRVSRALRGRKVKGVRYPGLIANGWVQVGGVPGTPGRLIAATAMLMAACDLTTNLRDPAWLPFPVPEGQPTKELEPQPNGGGTSANKADVRRNWNLSQMAEVPQPNGGGTSAKWLRPPRRDEIKSSSSYSSGCTSLSEGGKNDDDDVAARLEDENPQTPTSEPTPTEPTPSNPPVAPEPLPPPDPEQPPQSAPDRSEAILGDSGASEAVAMVRALFGETVADMVDADRDRIGREIEGRWDCYEAAVLVAATVRKKPTNPLPYLLTSALRNVREGIGSEADAARRKLAAKIKVEEGRASAEAERRRPVESDPELSREEEIALLLAQLREWSPRNPYRPRAERRLAELGHGKQDPSPTN